MKNHRQKIISILKHFEIEHWESGKNVSIDSVNVQCPFCDDHSNHMGIFDDTLKINCWRCSQRGPFEFLLSELTGFTEAECKRIIEDYDETFRESSLDQIVAILNKEPEEKKQHTSEVVELPQYFELITYDTDFSLLTSYMRRRKISIDTLIQHTCGICRVGQYMNRMIIPIFLGGEVVAYQAADLTGKADLKYRTGPPGVFINDYLYGYDDIEEGGTMLPTEGILDAWRLGVNAVATFGTSLTEKQKQLILDKKLKKLIAVWDPEAYWEARKTFRFFEPFIEEISIIKISDTWEGQDPDSLGKEGVYKQIEEENG
jgi:hypothetical protein